MHESRMNPCADELHPSPDVQTFEEFGRWQDTGRRSGDKDDRKRRDADKAAQRVVTSTLAVAAVVVLTIAPISIFEPVFGPVFGPMFEPLFGPLDPSDDTGMTAQFTDVDVSGDTVWYSIHLENVQGDESFTVELSNRFTDRTQSFSGNEFSSSEAGLKPGMEYTLELKHDGRTLASQSVTTSREVLPVFVHIESAECMCMEDGTFHLDLDVHADEGVEVTVTLTDWYGNSSSVQVHAGEASYRIPVTAAGLIGDWAAMEITSTESLDDGTVRETLLHSGDYMI